MKREKRIIITLSMDEYRAIQGAAAMDGRSVAAYIRHAAVDRAKPREGNAPEGGAGGVLGV